MTCSSQSGREAVSSEIYQFAVRQADKERKRVDEGKLTLNCLVSQGDWDIEELSRRMKDLNIIHGQFTDDERVVRPKIKYLSLFTHLHVESYAVYSFCGKKMKGKK